MELNCKDGDLAVIMLDEPGLEANVGRLVWVYGPMEEDAELGWVWRTYPATEEQMFLADRESGTAARRPHTVMVHPDAWMRPTRLPQLGSRPPMPVEPVPFTREWLTAIQQAGGQQVYLELGDSGVRKSGAELRRLAWRELCIPVSEDYGWRKWLWFPRRSLSATAHWWVHEAPPRLIGDAFLANDDDGYALYEELTEDTSLPWLHADGDWDTWMALPARFEANLIPRFARASCDVSDCGSIKVPNRSKDGRFFRWIEDYDRLLANWRISEAVADSSEPEAFLENLARALERAVNPLPTINA